MIYETLAIMAIICCCIFVYWKTRLKGWILLAFGLFLYVSNIANVIFSPLWKWKFAPNLGLITTITVVVVSLFLVLTEYRLHKRQL